MSRLKDELIAKIDFAAEYEELLGKHAKGQKNLHRCFNTAAHSGRDSTDLSYSPEHGGYRCHACGESGDIFTLYMKVNGWSFPQALEHLLKKYGLFSQVADPLKKSMRGRSSKRKPFTVINDKSIRSGLVSNMRKWSDDKLEFMRLRYGLTPETLRKYWISRHPRTGRVDIPIFTNSVENDSSNKYNLPSIVNIRKHDCFRSNCQWMYMSDEPTVIDGEEWVKGMVSRRKPESVGLGQIASQNTFPWEPVYGPKTGKVTNHKGHGANYIYPFNVLYENPMVYLVGGELKALLLIQLGVNAVSWTGGEGSFNEELAYYFMGKTVRILFDADPGGKKRSSNRLPPHLQEWCSKLDLEGMTNAEVATFNVAVELANHGAFVEAGVWTQEAKESLPDKGDITDLLAMMGYAPQAVACLDDERLIKWHKVERMLTKESVEMDSVETGEEVPAIGDMKEIHFRDLVEPQMLHEWVRTSVVVSGRGEAPFVVPSKANVVCKQGQVSPLPLCGRCGVFASGCNKRLVFPVQAQIELVGNDTKRIEAEVMKRAGVPKGCRYPEVDLTPSAIENVVMTPTVEITGQDWDDEYEYAHRSAYFMSENRHKITENTEYEVGGKVIADQRGKFSIAVTEYRDKADSVFKWRRNGALDKRLEEATSNGVSGLVSELRDFVCQIYGQDGMLLAIALSYFLPFTFRIGHFRQERICPGVMVLGDTNTGKSTTVKRLTHHFGAGRYASADSNPTFAGLVGGNFSFGGKDARFSWGLLPTSHMAHVAFDEYNKLNLEDVGRLTNTLSSGVAERVTASGKRRTKCWVRMLYLANPRGARRLTSFHNPLEAAERVVGTVQDLGRLEYVWVQYAADSSIFADMPKASGDPRYTTDVARYHLSWAWSRRPNQILFKDPEYVMRVGWEVAKKFGSHPLMLPAAARFKIGRVAAGFAAMLYSRDADANMVVENEHVDMAARFFDKCYEKWINTDASGAVSTLPEALIRFLDNNMNNKQYKRLMMLSRSDQWSTDDIHDVFGGRRDVANDFIGLMQFELGLITRWKRFYRSTQEGFQQQIGEYVTERDKIVAATREWS